MGFLRRGRIAQSHNGGKAQVGLWFPEPYYDNWAVNVCKMQLNPFQATGADNTNWAGLINEKGYPTAIPTGSGAKWVSSQLYIYGTGGDVWVLDWEGTATLGIATTSFTGGGLTESTINANRREYTITGTPTGGSFGNGGTNPALLVSLQITAISAASLNNIRLYRKADEARINGSGATSIFTQEFLDRVKTFGVIRFMDWHRCNTSHVYRPEDWNVEADYKWEGPFSRGSWFYGTATQTLNKQTISTLPALVHGLPVQFWMPARPINKVITATSTGAITQFTIAGHGFTNGDLVTIDLGASGGGGFTTVANAPINGTGLQPIYAVTVLDADTITIPLNSTGFAAPSGTFRLLPAIQISDGVVTKRVVRQGMTNHFNSEWAGFASGGLLTATYDADFGVFVATGDSPALELGVPPSVLIALANYCRTHPWFAPPIVTSDAGWTALATLVKNNLSPGLVPRFEVGNEVWNPGFYGTNYAAARAVKLDSSNSNNLGYAGRVAEVSDLIKAVYGAGSNWQMVMAVQAVSSISTSRFQGNARIQGGAGSAGYPLNKCDLLAYAPYVVPPFQFNSRADLYTGFVDTVDDFVQGNTTSAFNWILNELTSPTNNNFDAGQKDQALDYYISIHTPRWYGACTDGSYTGRNGLTLTHYEGNGSAVPGGIRLTGGFPAVATSGRTITAQNVIDFWQGYLASAQAATQMTNYLTRMAAAGVVYPSLYVAAGPWTNLSNWGSYRLNSFAASATPQYTALLNWNAP